MANFYLSHLVYTANNPTPERWEVLASDPDNSDSKLDGLDVAAEFEEIRDIAAVVDGVVRDVFSSREDDRVYLLDTGTIRVYHRKNSMRIAGSS